MAEHSPPPATPPQQLPGLKLHRRRTAACRLVDLRQGMFPLEAPRAAVGRPRRARDGSVGTSGPVARQLDRSSSERGIEGGATTAFGGGAGAASAGQPQRDGDYNDASGAIPDKGRSCPVTVRKPLPPAGSGRRRGVVRKLSGGTKALVDGEFDMTGCGAAWLARLTGGQEVGSSNLPSPTQNRSSATQSPFGLAVTSEDGLRLQAPVADKAVTRGSAESSHQRLAGVG